MPKSIVKPRFDPPCHPHADRGLYRPGVTLVGETLMCADCFKGKPIEERAVRARELRLQLTGDEDRRVRLAAVRPAQLVAEEIVAPFMANVEAPGRCPCCGGSRRPRHTYCAPCGRAAIALSNVKSWLRRWRDRGDVKCLLSAAGVIKRHGLRPQDLELF